MAMPDARLLCAASFVRPGAFLADIGTDHAYLPLYLLSVGRISRAIAADIGAGPLSRARAHIAAAGYAAAVETVQTDGLVGLDGRGITDIAICGMGGELIAHILAQAPFVKDPALRLILQPMTRASALRSFLAAEGFTIKTEKVCRAGGRVYSCLLAVYDGQTRILSPAEAEVGCPRCDTAEEKAAFAELLARKIRVTRRRGEALLAAGHSAEEEMTLLSALLLIEKQVMT